LFFVFSCFLLFAAADGMLS